MRILVLNNAAPFIRGGAEELADNLVRRLNDTRGIEAELLRLPFRWDPAERLIEEIVLHRHLELVNVDCVLGLKFPAYLVPHPRKTLWLLHQFRQAYDLYVPGQTHIDFDGRGEDIVRMIRTADDICFASCRAIFTNSPVTQRRLNTFNQCSSEVLYPPLNDPERFSGGDYGDYIFAGGRVAPGKRQHLLLEAVADTHSSVRVIIAGPSESDSYAARLRALIAKLGLETRVELRLGYRDRDEIAELVNGALACVYLPVEEDSLGYVTMEAFAARKAVITTLDSGGLLEIVEDEVTGLVVPAGRAALADALSRLSRDKRLARTLGKAAGEALERRRLNWDSTIARLLGAL